MLMGLLGLHHAPLLAVMQQQDMISLLGSVISNPVVL